MFSSNPPKPGLAIGSLFSGVAGLELGLEWAFESRDIAYHVMFQVESDPFCRQVLELHYPYTRRYDDVRTFALHSNEYADQIDLLCGGFPCQDVSSAGKRAGLTGDRSGLWVEFDRIVGQLHPGIVVVENVASGASLWVDRVQNDLGRRGYATLPIPLEARHVGALHRRSRIFVIGWIAYANECTQRAFSGQPEVACAPVAPGAAGAYWRATNPHGAALRDGAERQPGGQPGSVRDQREPLDPFPSWGSAEPELVRMVHGFSDRLDRRQAARRRHALGNSVVPQCAEVVGHVLIEMGLL